MKLYAHKPIPKCNVKIEEDKPAYRCNGQGIVMLPGIFKQFNPIEEIKIKKKKPTEVEE